MLLFGLMIIFSVEHFIYKIKLINFFSYFIYLENKTLIKNKRVIKFII